MASPTPAHSEPVFSGCWCCGQPTSDAELVRLGAHPEVGICADCARFVKRRADALRDQQHTTPVGLLRRGITVIRDWVIAHGWHDRGQLGALLRWLDRHLP